METRFAWSKTRILPSMPLCTIMFHHYVLLTHGVVSHSEETRLYLTHPLAFDSQAGKFAWLPTSDPSFDLWPLTSDTWGGSVESLILDVQPIRLVETFLGRRILRAATQCEVGFTTRTKIQSKKLMLSPFYCLMLLSSTLESSTLGGQGLPALQTYASNS